MATDGADTLLRPRMMCMALWAAKHEVKHCIKGEILDDCPLVEIVTCKDCKYWNKETEYCKHWTEDAYYTVHTGADFYCEDARRK